MIWLLPQPAPPSPSPGSKLDRRHTGRLRKRDNLQTGEGEGMGEEPNHATAKKPGPLYIIQYFLVGSLQQFGGGIMGGGGGGGLLPK
jgi:hypothetical protein